MRKEGPITRARKGHLVQVEREGLAYFTKFAGEVKRMEGLKESYLEEGYEHVSMFIGKEYKSIQQGDEQTELIEQCIALGRKVLDGNMPFNLAFLKGRVSL